MFTHLIFKLNTRGLTLLFCDCTNEWSRSHLPLCFMVYTRLTVHKFGQGKRSFHHRGYSQYHINLLYLSYFNMADHLMNNSVCKNDAAAYDHSLPGTNDWLHIGTRSVNSRNCTSFLQIHSFKIQIKYLLPHQYKNIYWKIFTKYLYVINVLKLMNLNISCDSQHRL